ncbi:MAG: methyltransferase domain-containing protein [Candidatus Woesearchaeota archaeon]
MAKIQKILIHKDKKYFWKGSDMHTEHGVIYAKDIKKAKKLVKSHKGVEFTVSGANFLDMIERIKRGPQTLLPKDLATILFYSGVDKESKVLDAGTGCGLLAITLARAAKSVVSYERNKKNIEIAKYNQELLGIENLKIRYKDIYEGITEKNLDIITLDLPEPWQVLPHALKALKSGGRLISYLPSVPQVMELVERAEGFWVIRVFETLERDWKVEGRAVRPRSKMMAHTAFITILRKK